MEHLWKVCYTLAVKFHHCKINAFIQVLGVNVTEILLKGVNTGDILTHVLKCVADKGYTDTRFAKQIYGRDALCV